MSISAALENQKYFCHFSVDKVNLDTSEVLLLVIIFQAQRVVCKVVSLMCKYWFMADPLCTGTFAVTSLTIFVFLSLFVVVRIQSISIKFGNQSQCGKQSDSVVGNK